jgi:uncharacterized membrane protein
VATTPAHNLRWGIVLAAALVYAIALSFFAIRAHHALQTQMNDLGNMDHAIWAAANDDWSMTHSNTRDGRFESRLVLHANLIFYPISFLYRIWADPRLLLVLTSLACAAAAVGIYALTLRRIGSTWWTLIPPLAFLASPLVHDANLYDFHVITLATAFLVGSAWAFSSGRTKTAWAFLVLALLCKEDVPFVGLFLGLHYLLTGERRRGVQVMAVCGAYIVVVLAGLIPLLNEGQATTRGPAGRYAWLLETPERIPEILLRPDRLRLPLYFILSGGLAAWRARSWLLVTLPHLAMGIFSFTTWMTRLTGTYYYVTVEAVIIIACTHAAGRKGRDGFRRWPLVYLGVATLVFSILFSPLPHGLWASWNNYPAAPHHKTLTELVDEAGIGSPEITLSVQNNLGPHVSQRLDVATFPRGMRRAEAVILHLRYTGGPASGLFVRSQPSFVYYPMTLQTLVASAKNAAKAPLWSLVAHRDGFYVFRKGVEGGFPAGEAIRLIEEDAVLLQREYEEAARARSPLAEYVVDGFNWDDIWRRLPRSSFSAP